MSKLEFIENVKTAATLLDPRAQTDSPQIDAGHIQGVLRRAVIWLTPSSVEGFSAKDFRELPEDRRAALVESVRKFREVAAEVPPDKPAKPEQIKAALPEFLKIIEAVRPYFWPDPETRRVLDVLEGIHFPDDVVGYFYRLDNDSTGEPAFWVWVIMEDATDADGSFLPKATEVRELIYEAVRKADLKRWPYISFRLASEQRTISSRAPR
jgi:hypothetical protein